MNCDFNTLWPSDAIWPHRSGSTLAQVLIWCLPAPSYYLNQGWLLIGKSQWQLNLQEIPQPSINRVRLKILLLKISVQSPTNQWVQINENGSTANDGDTYYHSHDKKNNNTANIGTPTNNIWNGLCQQIQSIITWHFKGHSKNEGRI